MKRLPLLALALIVAADCLAFSWGSRTTRIVAVIMYADGNALIRAEHPENPEGCGSGGYLVLDSTQPNFRALYATALTAQQGGVTVSLNYHGCVGPYPRIYGIATPSVW